MPLTKRSYSFHGKSSKQRANQDRLGKPDDQNTPACVVTRNSTLRKIKTRGKSFIGRKGNNSEENRESLSRDDSWQRDSVRLRSFRKRKMADRDEGQEVLGTERAKAFKMDHDDDIQRRIDDQIRMREGAMRLLSACGNVKQALDASKNLNAINARVLALMSALQKKRSSLVLKDYNKRNSLEVATMKACPARVAISNIRIPLMWKDDAHYKERSGDPYLLYYMFCFLKMGDHVLDTLLTQIDHKDTDVNFDGPFIFEKASADFKLDFEIYYTVIINPDRVHTPAARSSRKGGPLVNIPKYCLSAHAQFDVHNISDSIITSDLIMGGHGAHATAVLGQKEDLPENQLNLWGQVCLQLLAQPSCMLSDQKKGSLYLQESNGGQSSWGQYDCVLKQCCIYCKKANVPNGKEDTLSGAVEIKLRKSMRVTESKLNGLGKDHVLILESDGEEKEPVLGFDSHGQCMDWKLALEDSVTNIKAWGVACNDLMRFNSRHIKLIQSSPKQSFYDQILLTPVNGSANGIGERNGKITERIQDESSSDATTAMETEEVSVDTVEVKADKEIIADKENISVTEEEEEEEEEQENGSEPVMMESENQEVEDSTSSHEEAEEKLAEDENLRAETEQTIEEKTNGESSDEVKEASKETTELSTQDAVCSPVDDSAAQVEREVVDESGTVDESGAQSPEDKAEASSVLESDPVQTIEESNDSKDESSPVLDSSVDNPSQEDTNEAMSAIAVLDEVLNDEEDGSQKKTELSSDIIAGSEQPLTSDTPAESDGGPDEPSNAQPDSNADSNVDSVTEMTSESDAVEQSANTEDSKCAELSPSNLDEDELLNQKLDVVEHDDDELLNQKLNVYNSSDSKDDGKEVVERKPFVQTDI